MATIIKTSHGTFKAVIRSADGAYLKSKTFTRRGDAAAWAGLAMALSAFVTALLLPPSCGGSGWLADPGSVTAETQEAPEAACRDEIRRAA